ncbi:MAG: D-aminoacylase, partial [Microbacteriaceae bacterium]|nr:D-aminoacylase [Microbacteriaceae bacterium]
EAYLRQGVTSVIVGQDGLSFAPSDAASANWVRRYFAAVNGPSPDPLASGGSIAQFLDGLDHCGAINAATLIPAGLIRATVMGVRDQPATSAELRRMVHYVDVAMDEGAVGLSTGLDYVPGGFADSAELVELARPVGERGGVYVSHLRGYAHDRIHDSLLEAGLIAARSGARGHSSHLHGPADLLETALRAVEVEHGVNLSFDSYPYLRGSTILAMLVLPGAIQSDGAAATLARLGDPEVRRMLRDEAFPSNWRIDSIRLSSLSAPELRWAEGLGLREAAERSDADLVDFCCDALIACDLAIGCVVDNGGDRTEDDIRRMLCHPGQMAGSDAIFLGSAPHPRGWGAFARLLGRHVRELGDWTWGAAARHLSGHAAERFGIPDRGILVDGAMADIVVLDPETVADRSDYEHPTRPATGVDHVIVGGEFAMDDGVITGSRAGRALRSGNGIRS